ncbi:hypothetical protein DPMN_014207 [Dreissena polymorpha]|uniref:Uncharacterized protein n=1 Tax=Dreissena polymorpha TaxID=45954 RepID=A0A9D4N8R0_DREPO|nr:hypothetical protein DPMN_014207 [Dreissena polymorpha]
MEPSKGKKRGRPRNTRRRDLDADAKQMGQTWGHLERTEARGGSWLASYVPGGTTDEDEMKRMTP